MADQSPRDAVHDGDKFREAPRTLFWTAVDFALELRVGVRTLWRLHQGGKIPMPVKIGRNARWRRAECEIWQELGCPDRQTWEAMKAEGHVPGLEPYPAVRPSSRTRRRGYAAGPASDEASGRMNTIR